MIVMNKTILVVFLITMTIIFSVRSIVKEIPDTKITGTYVYSECIYLNPLSSSTKEYQTELYFHKFSYRIEENKFTIYDIGNETTKEYGDIEYTKVDVYLDIDEFLSLQLDDFLESADARYDVYSDGAKVDYIIFSSGGNIFIAESKMIGGGNTVFTIFTIFSVGKMENTF